MTLPEAAAAGTPPGSPAGSGLTMYATSWCPFCAQLRRQLDRAGVAYDVVDIEREPGAAAVVEGLNGGNQTVPTLVYADGSSQTNPPLSAVLERLADLG